MRKNRRAINVFGSKVSNAYRYPAPRHDTIIEPFAGGAGYSLLHSHLDVVLADVRPAIVEVWRYLIRAAPEAVLALPLIKPEQKVAELDCDEGGKRLISWCLNQGPHPATRPSSWANYHTAKGAASYWSEARRKQCAEIAGRIGHWSVEQCSYEEFGNYEATWFIDPPYADLPRVYQTPALDYPRLGEWCRLRIGQVIACERVGASWLPFEPLYSSPTARRFGDGTSKSCNEAVWTK
jgi:hypothetical protein